MLGPLQFKPIVQPKIWGAEIWTLSAQGEFISEVERGPLAGSTLDELMEVYMDELVGEHVFDLYGRTFPLLFKRIDARDDLSIQVHPNDDQAENGMGKSEMWYVTQANDEASIVVGFDKATNRKEVEQHIADNTLSELVNHSRVQVGDVAYIPAGTIHALCRGTQVMEIQQSSDTTYRLFDYGRKDKQGNPRQLHIDQGLSVLNYKRELQPLVYYEDREDEVNTLVSDPHFVTNLLHLTAPAHRDTVPLDSFVVYMCLEGACTINDIPMRSLLLGEEKPLHTDTIFIPACINDVVIRPQGKVKLLEIYIP